MTPLLVLAGLILIIWLLIGMSAAPTPTARVDPTSATVIMLRNGYRALITFAYDSNVEVWEKNTQPSGFEGGGGVETTTFFNSQDRTMAPRALIKSKPTKVVCAYDPIAKSSLKSLMLRETTITELFPDGSTYCYYGFLDDADFSVIEDGKQPEVTLTIIPTNWDPTNKVEAAGVFTGVTGT